MKNRENSASSTDIFSGDLGIRLLRRLALAGVLLAAPGCRDEVVFAELAATRAKLEACQAEKIEPPKPPSEVEQIQKKRAGEQAARRRAEAAKARQETERAREAAKKRAAEKAAAAKKKVVPPVIATPPGATTAPRTLLPTSPPASTEARSNMGGGIEMDKPDPDATKYLP